MNVEPNDVARRAAVHGALADPSRLRIVDTLTLGDASPSELAAMLAMPSNLLAHHLNVLEDDGLVARTRSEGDRRRSYVRLVREALDGVTPGTARAAHRVLFVCTANSARSQLAVALWRQVSNVPAVSAGTDPADRIDPRAIRAAQRHRLPMRRVRPRRIEEVRSDGDLIITVCDLAHEVLAQSETGIRADLHWSIADPVRAGDLAAFERVLHDLTRRVGDLAPRLHPPATT